MNPLSLDSNDIDLKIEKVFFRLPFTIYFVVKVKLCEKKSLLALARKLFDGKGKYYYYLV